MRTRRLVLPQMIASDNRYATAGLTRFGGSIPLGFGDRALAPCRSATVLFFTFFLDYYPCLGVLHATVIILGAVWGASDSEIIGKLTGKFRF